MILKPSQLNPIHIFQPDEQVYWLNNQNLTADRGNYKKEFVINDECYIYTESSEAAVNFALLKCSDYSQILSGSVPSIGGGLFALDYSHPDTFPDSSFLFLYSDVNQGDIQINPLIGTPTAATDSAAPAWLNAFIKVPYAFLLNRIEIEVTVGVAGDYPFQLHVARNGNLDDLELLYSTPVNFPVGTYVADIDIFPNTGWSKAAIFSKGDIIIVSVQNTPGGDIEYRYNNPTGFSDTWFGFDFIPTYRYLQPAARLYGYEGAISELIYNREVFPKATGYYYPQDTVEIRYSNKKQYLQSPANVENRLYVSASFWQQDIPQEYEDIEVSPGEFHRLRNEQHRVIKMETDFLPGYMHEKLKFILSCDTVKINSIEFIQRNPYTFNYTSRHYALSKGEVMLTERKSIKRKTI